LPMKDVWPAWCNS